MLSMAYPFMLALVLSMLFYYLAMKKYKKSMSLTLFECGFSSYFYSRFSFSIHYYYVGLLFLFLDLELCFIMPMMGELWNSPKMAALMLSFLASLLLALITEWKEKNIEWKN